MPQTGNHRQAALSRRDRILLIVLAAALLALLAAAALLEPDPQGLGTHQRLGLPPCSVRVLLGIRCPTCGMTTAWAHLVRGQWIDALRANVGGTLLAILAMAAVSWSLASAVRGRWLVGAPNGIAAAAVALGIVLITFVDWIVRLIAG